MINIKTIDKYLEKFLSNKDPVLLNFFKMASLGGGKRLRAFIYLSAKKKITKRDLKIAVILELLHAGTLIHDDILDNSPIRRGQKTLYLKTGIPSSLLYGDYVFVKSFELLSGLEDIKLFKEIVSVFNEVLKGEIYEYAFKKNLNLDFKKYINIIRMKTALLFALSLKISLSEGRKSKLMVQSGYDAGIYFGIAYQLLDDYNDYFGKNTDKQNFTDIKCKLMTLPLIKLVETADALEKKLIKNIFSNKKIREADISRMLKMMKKYNIQETCKNEILKYFKLSYNEAEQFDGNKTFLEIIKGYAKNV